MKIVMDSDVLIKLTKASVKELATSNFEIHIPPEVEKEAVNEGKNRGYPDALVIDENIKTGKLKVSKTTRLETTEKLISNLNLLGGEADSIRLFKQGNYEALASDDSRFIDLIDGLGIPYITPSVLLIYLWKIKAISKKETREFLDKIKEFINPEEYLASVEELAKE
jgi:hypothetical protein